MNRLYTNERFLEHKTGNHPESAKRLTSVVNRLSGTDLWKAFHHPTWQPATVEDLSRLHAAQHIDRVRQYAESGGGRIEADTMVSAKSYDVACLAAGAVCDAVTHVVGAAEPQPAFCLCRPPGHHAKPNGPMGFCLFNNIAIGARLATERLELERVLIVDWDVHHGNGTQDAFWKDPRVHFLSIHRWPFYPGSGSKDETGADRGKGTIKNLPIAFGTSRKEYRDRFTQALESMADALRPELVLLSAGFDTHRLDPIGSLGLETEDFAWLTQLVRDVARTHCSSRLVSVLEGGYNTDVLPDCVETHMRVLAGRA